MPVCSFCKNSFNAPRGITIFQLDGKALHYCTSKCRRNAALKRDPRKTAWVKKSDMLNKAVSTEETISAKNSEEK